MRLAAFLFLAAVLAHAEHARRGPVDLSKDSIYQVWMRSFTPEGTLNAAAKRLPHIASLGATIVYLSPINLQSRQGGFSNPYRISDYSKIDPEYGSEADLKAFVASAHQLGLKVLMDVVFYHTALDNMLMTEHPDYYMHKDGKVELGIWHLPRPDFANSNLRQFMIDNLIHWVSADQVDGYRADVAWGVPVDFWDQARDALDKVNKKVILLAESDRPAELVHAFDMTYNFPYLKTVQKVFHDGAPASEIRKNWEESHAKFPQGALLLRATDNHDQQRAIVLFSEAGMQAASVMNFMLDGIPYLYNGQEIGDTVATDHQSHYPIRWELDKNSDLTGQQRERVEWFHKLYELRAKEPELTSAEVTWLDNSTPDSLVSYRRGHVLVLVNASNRQVSGHLNAPGSWHILLQKEGDSLNSGTYNLGSFGYIVAKSE